MLIVSNRNNLDIHLSIGVPEEAGDCVDDDVGSDHDPVHVHVRDLVFDDVLHADMLMLHRCQFRESSFPALLLTAIPIMPAALSPMPCQSTTGVEARAAGSEAASRRQRRGVMVTADWGLETRTQR